MEKAVVLGVGRVGSLIARTLSGDGLAVRAVDARAESLAAFEPGIETRVADLTDPREFDRAVSGANVAVLAVPGFLGFDLLERIVGLGIPAVDISFLPENALALDEPARRSGARVVVDCGVAPGLSNLMVGVSVATLDSVEEVRILVGGLPEERDGGWDYRAVFSPADVIEEYVRPCRMRLSGNDVVVPALTDVERLDFPGIGTLEAFNTDGLRTLLETVRAPTMVEKTLRWPGHAERARALRDSGFLDLEPVEVGNARVVPRALAVELLSREWALGADEKEFTLLRVEVAGSRDGKPARDVWTLLDRTEPGTGATSMARTTGFPAVALAKALAVPGAVEPGVHPPELLGSRLVDAVLEEVRSRGVEIRRSQE